jgi:uncharacterized membrane protein
MTDIDGRSGLPESAPLGVTHLVYALHAWSAIIGITSTAFIVTAFLAGWPSIIAVILNYVKRPDVRGTFLESHFRWQIRTFWFAVLWSLVALAFFITFVGIPFAWIIAVVVGLWILYRIVRGWLALVSERPLPMPS